MHRLLHRQGLSRAVLHVHAALGVVGDVWGAVLQVRHMERLARHAMRLLLVLVLHGLVCGRQCP